MKKNGKVGLIALSYLYSLKRFIDRFTVSHPNIFIYSKSTLNQIYNFVYYKLSALVKICFASVTRYKICPHKGIYKQSMQLKIQF